MPDLTFEVVGAEAVAFAAEPMIRFLIRVRQVAEPRKPLVCIHSVQLRCQIRLEPARRRYSPTEQEKLFDLFGEPHRWGQTVRSQLWAHCATVVHPFVEETGVDLQVPCTYDFNIASTKYFDALEDRHAPLVLLFSGTIFYEGESNVLQVGQISWEKEAEFRLPVAVWRHMMDLYYPGVAWLCVRRDLFDRLAGYKRQIGTTSVEEALERLLESAGERIER